MAVAIVVEKAAAGAPTAARTRDARLFGNVSEGAVAIVVIKNVAAPVAHEQVLEAVVIVIGRAAALAPSGIGQTGLLRDIRECAIAIVSEQKAGGFSCR